MSTSTRLSALDLFKRQSQQVTKPHRRLFDVTKLVINVGRALEGFVPSDETQRQQLIDEQDVLLTQQKSTGLPEPPLGRTETFVRKAALGHAARKLSFFTDTETPVILDDLAVNRDTGLSTKEAALRLTLHGRNELEKEPPRSFLMLLLDQFSDLLVIMLIVASIVSMALGQYSAATVIIIIVIANAILGVVQESKAGAALDALESMSAPLATVLRDGQLKEVDSGELVPGDIVILDAGKKIPADIRLIESQELSANESSLTGESEPVKKDANWIGGMDEDEMKGDKEKELSEKNMIYMGCAVQEGRGRGVVIKTGMKTKMGEIAHLLQGAESGDSPLQIKLHGLGVRLGLASIFISLVVFVIGVTTKRGVDPADDNPAWLQMLLVAVSLTVASVPEGLPACVTITLAVGMAEMVKHNALIRNLHSVETLGSASVICTDKTGTLTKGEMTAVRLWHNFDIFRFTGLGYQPKGELLVDTVKNVDAYSKETTSPHTTSLWLSFLCSNAQLQQNDKTGEWECVGNMSERPLVVGAAKVGIYYEQVKKLYNRIHENPFNSARKMMSTLIDADDAKKDKLPVIGESRYFSAVKGAPNFILKNCTHLYCGTNTNPGAVREMTQEDRDAIFRSIDDFSSKAFRVLAIACRPFDNNDQIPDTDPDNLESNLILCGMVASIDPERDEVKVSIRKAANAGIRTVMITGDYVKTAKAIAENIGLLPRGSPDDKAVDCAIIREMGDKIKNIEEQINACMIPSDRTKLETQLGLINDRLDTITSYADVYARAKPVDKITIVRSLQRQGNVCSMTGDGVNDAPALKQANIGVAMGITGTDVAKASADMVLTDDNFCSIVDAIEQGRTIYANITKFVFFLLSTNVSEVFVILFATAFFGLQTPLLPIQILWLNLATDGAPAIALAVENIEPGLMDEGPRARSEPLLEKVMITGICIQTVVLTSIVLGTYILGLTWYTDSWDGQNDMLSAEELEKGVKKARTMTILIITFAELLRAYTARSLRQSIFRMGVFTNKWMQYAVGISIVATILIAHIPGVRDVFGMEILDGKAWVWILFMSLVPVTSDEITKYIYRYIGFGVRPKVNRVEAEITRSTSFQSTGAAHLRVKSTGSNFAELVEPDMHH